MHASRAASLYRAASANPRSAADAQFLSDEAVRQCKILAAFELADAGTSLLAPLLGNVRTAATLASELVPSPQTCPPCARGHPRAPPVDATTNYLVHTGIIDAPIKGHYPASLDQVGGAKPCPKSKRAYWPAFSHTVDARPLSQHTARAAFKDCAHTYAGLKIAKTALTHMPA